MAITLNPTPASNTANTYATVTEADAFAEALFDVDASAWTSIEETDRKNALLVRAARLLDTRVEWVGERSTTTQVMEWPRLWVRRPGGGTYDGGTYGSVEIPKAVKDAQITLAAWLASRATTGDDPFGLAGTSALSSLSVGPISLEFRDAAPTDGFTFFDEAIVPILEAGGCIRRGNRLSR